jgi:adenylate cyclase
VSEIRKLGAILVSDVVGYSRLTGADEDRILARLRALRSDLIDPTIAVHHGRVVKRTGDGAIVEFRSVVDAVNCANEIQRAMVERNAEVPRDKRIEFRIGIHVGDVVEEGDGDLMGDGINIAARLTAVAQHPHRKSCFHTTSVDFTRSLSRRSNGRYLRNPAVPGGGFE